MPRRFALLFAIAAALGGTGCGTTRFTDTSRTATEQLLISQAVDEAVSGIDFRVLAGKKVFFDAQYLEKGAVVDAGYVLSSLRQQLLAHGALLQEDRTKAEIVVEARSGGIGTDRQERLIGVPQMSLPAITLYQGVPSVIPEIALAKRTNQRGAAKIAVFAYNRITGQPVWQSGTVESAATARDTWVLGAGPFRRGTLAGKGLDLGLVQVNIPPWFARDENEPTPPWVGATQPAVWLTPVGSSDAETSNTPANANSDPGKRTSAPGADSAP